MMVSIVLHLLVAVGIYYVTVVYPASLPQTFRVQFIPYPKGETHAQVVPENMERGLGEGAKPEPKQEAKPEPPPEPKPPEPKPPEPEVKPPEPPEPAKVVPKPEPEPKPEIKKPEPKPEAKKPEVKKPEPKKPEAKKNKDGKAPKKQDDPGTFRPSPKSTVAASPGSVAGDANGNDAYAHMNAPMKAGINMPEGTPTALDGWARLVQIKVEKNWQVPDGLLLNGPEDNALVSFWVDRQGNLIGKPEIMKSASDAQLGESGVQAVLQSVPLPELPESYPGMEQQVIYNFTLAQ